MPFSTVVSLLATTSTVAAFLPSLNLIRGRRRHFEVFVGFLHLLSTFLFDVAESLDRRVLGLAANDYHQVSDITTETYVCLLLIHLSGHRNEDLLHQLRYLAFGMCWFAKLGDGWSSVAMEAAVIIIFAAPPLLLLAASLRKREKIRHAKGGEGEDPFSARSTLRTFLTRKLPYNTKVAWKAGVCVAGALTLLVLENVGDTPFRLLHAGAQVMFGGATFFLWSALPCFDKDDMLPSFR